MLPERRRAHPIDWALLLAMLTQLAYMAIGYGRLTARVDGLVDRVARIERVMDDMVSHLRGR